MTFFRSFFKISVDVNTDFHFLSNFFISELGPIETDIEMGFPEQDMYSESTPAEGVEGGQHRQREQYISTSGGMKASYDPIRNLKRQGPISLSSLCRKTPEALSMGHLGVCVILDKAAPAPSSIPQRTNDLRTHPAAETSGQFLKGSWTAYFQVHHGLLCHYLSDNLAGNTPPC